MEPKSSLPCSQEPAIGAYPESDESSPHHPISPRHILIVFPSMPTSSAWSLFFRFFPHAFLEEVNQTVTVN
jgi:hypothetical protein